MVEDQPIPERAQTDLRRRVHFFLSSYRVRLHVPHEPLTREYVLFLRDTVREAIAEAMAEPLTPRHLVQSVRPHVLVADVRPGSIEFETILRAFAEIPWDQVMERGEAALRIGYQVVVELGSLAAGVNTVQDIGRWVTRRFLRRQGPRPNQGSRDLEVSAKLEAQVEVKSELPAGPEGTAQIDRTLESPTPSGLITVVSANALPHLDRRLRRLDDRHPPHLGGAILLRQLNLASNGVQTLEALREGDPLVIQNAPAFGLKRCDTPDTLYRACAAEPGIVALLGIKMNHYPEESELPRIVRGAPLDADNLPETDEE